MKSITFQICEKLHHEVKVYCVTRQIYVQKFLEDIIRKKLKKPDEEDDDK